MFKTIDRLLFKGILTPFLWTFGVAVFVLLMQMMWLYIDDIIGKGIGILFILEVIGYISISLFPLAFPIGILVSSVMVMGNMAEKYELSSFKSAGVSLLRVMRPLLLFASIVACFSLYCSHSLIPISNLKYRSKMFDIKQQKPALNLEKGVFNDDFKNLVIHIGDKNQEGDSLQSVMVYDHKNDQKRFSATIAQKGKLKNLENGQFLQMNLYDGHQYMQGDPNEENPYPFVRINFKEWRRIFDLSEFDIRATDEKLFKSHRQMLSITQLNNKIDTIETRYLELENKFNKYLSNKLAFYLDGSKLLKKDSIDRARQIVQRTRKGKNIEKPVELRTAMTTYAQVSEEKIINAASMIQTFDPAIHRRITERVDSELRGILSQAEASLRNLQNERRNFNKYIYEFHNRFATALICVVFLLIGAPMGAIIRKGGFGYPMLIAIIFFVVYIMQRVMFEKLVKEAIMNPIRAAWMPILILLPFGIFLTYMAMNDKKFIQMPQFVSRIFNSAT